MFWVWIVHAVVESVLVALLPLAMLPKSDPFNGILNTFWEAGALAYTAIIIIVNFKMIFIQHRWYPFSVLMIVLSILSWFLLAYLINIVIWIDFEFYMLWNNLLGNPTFWLGLLLIVFIIFGKDLYMSALGRYFHPSNAQTLQSVSHYITCLIACCVGRSYLNILFSLLISIERSLSIRYFR